jgi:hypothetical protein
MNKSLIVSLLFACVLLASIEESAAQGKGLITSSTFFIIMLNTIMLFSIIKGKKVVCYYGTWASKLS